MPSAMDNQMSSPKFITCPDCGERYDNGQKRRLIDTCGHPRCYSCLFVDKPCPLCQKIPQDPRSRSGSLRNDISGGSDESLNNLGNTLTSGTLSKDQTSLSHPDLSEIQKTRALTLPARGFRTDNYFRSLYRYDPHANDTADERDSKDKPRRVLNYHKSLENLSDEFWRSVERAASPLGRGRISPTRSEDSPPSSTLSSTDDVSSGKNRLSVPVQTRPRAATESLRAEALRKLEIAEGRPRANSEFIFSRKFLEGGINERHEVYNERGNFTLPRNFHMPESGDRGRAASDRSSDISQPFSDSCSESSGDSDHLSIGNPHSPTYRGITKRASYDENQNERLKIAEERLYTGLMRSEEGRKTTKSPVENVITWVIEPPKKEESHFNKVQQKHTNSKRPNPPQRGDSSRRASIERAYGKSTAL